MEFTIGRAFAVLMVAVACGRLCEAREDTKEVSHVCNGLHISYGDMATAWSRATIEVMSKTATNGYHYKAKSTVGGATFWAVGACNGRLQEEECARCMGSAMSQLTVLAKLWDSQHWSPDQVGGLQAPLGDLRLRLVDFDFNRITRHVFDWLTSTSIATLATFRRSSGSDP